MQREQCTCRFILEGRPSLGRSPMNLKIPLVLSPQPDGGYSVTSPVLPELHTDGDTADEAVANVQDALAAVIELYEDLGRPLPSGLVLEDPSGPVMFEALVTTP
jgi:antitoxin HicB